VLSSPRPWQRSATRNPTAEELPIPGTVASEKELLGIARGITQAGRKLREVVTDAVIRNDLAFVAKEIGWMRRVAASGWLTTFLLAQTNLLLCIETPATVYDLPAGMPQFIQTAQGYVAALVSG